mmetsp:Transcript_81372/g.264121  ORF Transcript_81372/g.264121 Transcript_81372/m.264121 type:complete len:207 (+) Transcript_81372:825-1445(+)
MAAEVHPPRPPRPRALPHHSAVVLAPAPWQQHPLVSAPLWKLPGQWCRYPPHDEQPIVCSRPSNRSGSPPPRNAPYTFRAPRPGCTYFHRRDRSFARRPPRAPGAARLWPPSLASRHVEDQPHAPWGFPLLSKAQTTGWHLLFWVPGPSPRPRPHPQHLRLQPLVVPAPADAEKMPQGPVEDGTAFGLVRAPQPVPPLGMWQRPRH